MRKWLLGGIILLAFLLRVVALDRFPVGFTPDEASFGYDAYSILKTGKDQWGHRMPLVLESFGDFKSPLYSYLSIPFVAIFGLNKFSVRLPNALLGTLAVYITYLLVKELVRNTYRENEREKLKNLLEVGNVNKGFIFFNLEILAATFLAISPWHVMMSRGAFEANLTTFFLPLGLYLLIKGIKDERFLVWSAMVLGLNLFTYHSAKFVTPIVLLTFIFSFREELIKLPKKSILLPTVIFSMFFLGFLSTFFQGSATRISDVNVFRGLLEQSSNARLNSILSGVPTFISRLIHNKFEVGFERFASNYIQYFSPQFLFSQGPAEGTYGMIPGQGVLYWFELPLLFGAFALIIKKGNKKFLNPLIFWLVVAPIPAALSTGPGYAANRAVIMLPVLQIFLALGVIPLLQWLSNSIRDKIFLRFILFGYFLICLFFFIHFIDNYFVQSPYKIARDMLYGNMEVAYWLSQNTSKKDTKVVSTKLSESHIYIAFINAWDPKNYQDEAKNWNYRKLGLGWVDQMPEYSLGEYKFRPINWESENRSDYIVGRPDEFPNNIRADIIINYPDLKPAIFVFSPEKKEYAQDF